jgi:hypothetical protein
MLLLRCTSKALSEEDAVRGPAAQMRLLEYLVEMFIQGFGITRPSEAQRRRVTFLLGGALLTAALLVLAVGVGMVFYLHMSH